MAATALVARRIAGAADEALRTNRTGLRLLASA
jgi:hypothetical protein